ncbi:pyrroline-5-carboxylate reductase 1-like [Anopheles bellator]|uniref:pyrroline-5-carboxylate reductase 1-like n=1 Tax=Anopheles bellator TaxID=139047 RepID=UPI0026482015|nr:pyrroline-5-carboxylate reductase 1-like [Anopheles bellator]
MRWLTVLSACLVAAVSARPEGYSYHTPQFGLSEGGAATSSASLVFGAGSGGGSHELDDCVEPVLHGHVNYFAPQQQESSRGHSESGSSSYQSASLGHHQHSHSAVETSPDLLPYYHQQPQQTHHKVHHEPQVDYFANVHQQQHHHGHHEATVQYVQQPVVKEEVHKHVYVHVAPEEKEEIHQKVILPTYTKQRHYKIIFIKAPSPPTPAKVVLPQQPANEEKTLVYVLHQKPELQQEIVVPQPATAKPSKPEVYFIKYKTKKEHQHQEEHHQSLTGSSSYGGYETSDLTGYGVPSFAPIVVTEGSYHQRHSTTAAPPVKLTTAAAGHHLQPSSSSSSSYVSSTARTAAVASHHRGQDISITNSGLSGYSSATSQTSTAKATGRGSKKSCRKCSKSTTSGQLEVSAGGTLDAFVSNNF